MSLEHTGRLRACHLRMGVDVCGRRGVCDHLAGIRHERAEGVLVSLIIASVTCAQALGRLTAADPRRIIASAGR
jgi:hypothetical protein